MLFHCLLSTVFSFLKVRKLFTCPTTRLCFTHLVSHECMFYQSFYFSAKQKICLISDSMVFYLCFSNILLALTLCNTVYLIWWLSTPIKQWMSPAYAQANSTIFSRHSVCQGQALRWLVRIGWKPLTFLSTSKSIAQWVAGLRHGSEAFRPLRFCFRVFLRWLLDSFCLLSLKTASGSQC